MKNQNRFLWLALLACAIFANGFVLKRWSQKDTRPLEWDQAIHTKAAFEYRDRFEKGAGLFELLKPAPFNYPPLYHMAVAGAIGKTSDLADTGAYVNLLFLIVLMVGVFLIADGISGPAAGFSAAFPFPYSFSKICWLFGAMLEPI